MVVGKIADGVRLSSAAVTIIAAALAIGAGVIAHLLTRNGLKTRVLPLWFGAR